MKGFIANVFPHRDKFISIKIARAEETRIQHLTLRLLQLKDLNQLRDRFEGIRFYTQFSRKVRGLIAIEKVLGVQIMNWGIRNIKELSNSYQIGERSFLIETIEYGKWPIIIPRDFETLILSIAKNEDTIWVVGSATVDSIRNDVQSVKRTSPVIATNHLVELSSLSNFSKFNSPSELSINS